MSQSGVIFFLLGDLQDAIMILANAIYFKGTWRHQFPKENTTPGGFYVSPTEIVEASYMKTTDTFYYFESNELDAKILRLPYKVLLSVAQMSL